VCDVGPADGGPVTPHAAHVSMTIPVMTQRAHRGKARTWNPLLIQVLANHHSTHARLHTQDREDASGPRDPVFSATASYTPALAAVSARMTSPPRIALTIRAARGER